MVIVTSYIYVRQQVAGSVRVHLFGRQDENASATFDSMAEVWLVQYIPVILKAVALLLTWINFNPIMDK